MYVSRRNTWSIVRGIRDQTHLSVNQPLPVVQYLTGLGSSNSKVQEHVHWYFLESMAGAAFVLVGVYGQTCR